MCSQFGMRRYRSLLTNSWTHASGLASTCQDAFAPRLARGMSAGRITHRFDNIKTAGQCRGPKLMICMQQPCAKAEGNSR